MTKDIIWQKAMNIMEPTCHQRHDRSYYLGNYQFPVCARCQGLYIGYLLGLLITNYYLIILFSLTYVDGYIQLKSSYTSTNRKRLITGLLSGIATTQIIKLIITFIFN